MVTGRAFEVTDSSQHETIILSASASSSKRMHHLDAEGSSSGLPAASEREAPEFPSDESQMPIKPHGRVDYLSGQVDNNEDAELEEKQQAVAEQQRRIDERLNPNWLDRQAAGPAFLLTAAFVLWYASIRYESPRGEISEFILLPYILAAIALLWMAVILLIDKYRPL